MKPPRSIQIIVIASVAIIAVPLLLISAVIGSSSSEAPPASASGDGIVGALLRADAPIPAQYVTYVNQAGHICNEITPALIAAQLDLESGWNPNAVAHNPASNDGDAKGIAQFQDSTWKTWGGDYNHNGSNSPFDGQDAIIAQGRFMCSNAAWANQQLAAGTIKGSVVELALAAYFCGRSCIARQACPPVAPRLPTPNKCYLG